MKHLFNQFLSVFLVLTMVVSGSLTSLASDCTTSNYSYDFSTETEVPFEEEISIAQNAYAELSPEAKVLFENSLLEDPELLAFHRTYVDSYFTVDTSMHRAPSAYAVSASNPLSVLSSQLNSLGLPTAVVYSLKALGASMAAALADGPLPAGDIVLAATTVGVIAAMAANWKSVSPKFNGIVRAFNKSFAGASSSIASAFSNIKTSAKKKASETAKAPTGNKVRDVHKRLKKEGFKKQGQSGSHEKWKKENRTVTVPNHGENYEIPIGTLRNIWKQAGWI